MYKDLGINDIVNDKNFLIVGFNFRAPNMQIYVRQYAKQSSSAVGMCQFCKQSCKCFCNSGSISFL